MNITLGLIHHLATSVLYGAPKIECIKKVNSSVQFSGWSFYGEFSMYVDNISYTSHTHLIHISYTSHTPEKFFTTELPLNSHWTPTEFRKKKKQVVWPRRMLLTWQDLGPLGPASILAARDGISQNELPKKYVSSMWFRPFFFFDLRWCRYRLVVVCFWMVWYGVWTI